MLIGSTLYMGLLATEDLLLPKQSYLKNVNIWNSTTTHIKGQRDLNLHQSLMQTPIYLASWSLLTAYLEPCVDPTRQPLMLVPLHLARWSLPYRVPRALSRTRQRLRLNKIDEWAENSSWRVLIDLLICSAARCLQSSWINGEKYC